MVPWAPSRGWAGKRDGWDASAMDACPCLALCISPWVMDVCMASVLLETFFFFWEGAFTQWLGYHVSPDIAVQTAAANKAVRHLEAPSCWRLESVPCSCYVSADHESFAVSAPLFALQPTCCVSQQQYQQFFFGWGVGTDPCHASVSCCVPDLIQ